MSGLEDQVAVLKAAAEPTRLRLMALCARAELSVSDLTGILGQSQPRVSRHLKLLCEAGILERFREGPFAFFRLARMGAAAALASGLVAGLEDAAALEDADLARDRQRLAALMEERRREADRYFEANAERWDEIRALHLPAAEVEHRLMALVPEEGVEAVLDIGTGTGRILELLAPQARLAVGIDSSRPMLQLARAAMERAGLAHASVRPADMYALPFPAESFDLAVVHMVLHYAEAPGAAVAEAARVLKPGGRLVVVDFLTHERESLRSEHAHRRLGFAHQELAAWFAEAGLALAPAEELPGGDLTVVVWVGQRPAAPAARVVPHVNGGSAHARTHA